MKHRERRLRVLLKARLRPARSRSGFTLLELLTVLVVIAILAGLLFPAISAAKTAARIARTRVQFNQWAAGIEGFRSEYGYYPALHSSNLVNPPGQSADSAALHLFHDLLAARRRDGGTLPAYSSSTNPQFPEGQNRRLIAFCAFGPAELTPGYLLCDAFGNTQIAVLVDRDLDGFIRVGTDVDTLPAVGGITPTADDFPSAGIRAGVLLYAPAPGATSDNPRFIFSWK